MSDRIKKLAEQAFKEIVGSSGGAEWYGDATHKAFCALFAELLVKECAEIADMAYDGRCRFPGDYIVESFDLGEEEGAAAWRCR